MTGVQERLKPLLFKGDGTNVYAALDGASIEGLLDKLYARERPQFECLYRGELPPDMAEVAPYLVRLEPAADFTEWLLRECWGKHWGIFAVTPADMKTMRGHLRKFLIVYDPDAKPLYFRFYDPRVLRTYLPSSNAHELAEFFGPVNQFIAEGEEPDTILRYQLAGGKLVLHQEPPARA